MISHSEEEERQYGSLWRGRVCVSADTAAQVGAGAPVMYTARHLELLTLMAALKWIQQDPVDCF
jgi:hypothetical protein